MATMAEASDAVKVGVAQDQKEKLLNMAGKTQQATCFTLGGACLHASRIPGAMLIPAVRGGCTAALACPVIDAAISAQQELQ